MSWPGDRSPRREPGQGQGPAQTGSDPDPLGQTRRPHYRPGNPEKEIWNVAPTGKIHSPERGRPQGKSAAHGTREKAFGAVANANASEETEPDGQAGERKNAHGKRRLSL